MDSRIREALEQGIAIQKKNYGNATELHLDMMDWVKVAQDALLTAEPEPCQDARAVFRKIIGCDCDDEDEGTEIIDAYASRLVREAMANERRRDIERYIKILKLAREKIQDHVNEIYSSGGVEYLGLGSTLDGIDKVLKELESNG